MAAVNVLYMADFEKSVIPLFYIFSQFYQIKSLKQLNVIYFTSYGGVYNSLFLFFNRITIIAHCNMDLRLYPMDTQHCELRIESCE